MELKLRESNKLSLLPLLLLSLRVSEAFLPNSTKIVSDEGPNAFVVLSQRSDLGSHLVILVACFTTGHSFLLTFSP